MKLRLHNSIFHFPVMLYRVRVSISETHVYCCVCSCDMQSKYSVFCHFRHHHQNVQQRWGHRLWVSLNFKNLKPQTKCCIHPSALISTACRAAVTTIVWTPGSPEDDGVFVFHFVQQDSRALLHLGRCYDRGFGVQQSSTLATGYYERAARAGNSQALGLLRLRREGEDRQEGWSTKKMHWAGA